MHTRPLDSKHLLSRGQTSETMATNATFNASKWGKTLQLSMGRSFERVDDSPSPQLWKAWEKADGI